MSTDATAEHIPPKDPQNPYELPGDVVLTKVSTALSETVDYSLGLLHIPDLHKQTMGEDVLDAVLDTGYYPHPDLDGGVIKAVDFTNSPIGPDDYVSHGTWCLGMIGARANGVGVIGIAPKCSLLSGKVLNDSGSGNVQSILAGVEWADSEGADVISMSLGGPDLGPELHQALIRFLKRRPDRAVFCAAGNSGVPDDVDYPAKYPESICVGAVDKNGVPTRFSNKGNRVDIWTYGVDMVSTTPRGYSTMSGTSMSTPQAAGVYTLMLSYARKRGGTIGGYEMARKIMRETMAGGVIVPGEALKRIMAPVVAPPSRRKVFSLGGIEIYSPPLATDDAGIVFATAESKTDFLAQVALIGKAE